MFYSVTSSYYSLVPALLQLCISLPPSLNLNPQPEDNDNSCPWGFHPTRPHPHSAPPARRSVGRWARWGWAGFHVILCDLGKTPEVDLQGRRRTLRSGKNRRFRKKRIRNTADVLLLSHEQLVRHELEHVCFSSVCLWVWSQCPLIWTGKSRLWFCSLGSNSGKSTLINSYLHWVP